MSKPLAEDLRDRLASMPPVTHSDCGERIHLEMKPYLQPFEVHLAVAELEALAGGAPQLDEAVGIWCTTSSADEDLLRRKLTYWQRVGRSHLLPTDQVLFELTQVGGTRLAIEGARLHGSRRLRYGAHALHEYRGKFFPQLVRSLVSASGVGDGSLIVDPMCGSGTTPSEALAAGHRALGADLNPLSVLISQSKCSVVASGATGQFMDAARRIVDGFDYSQVDPADTWAEPDLDYLTRWFDPQALVDIATVKAAVDRVADARIRSFLLVCFSDVLRSVSWQKEVDLRVRKEVKPYTAGDARRRFEEAASSQIDRIRPYLEILGDRACDTYQISEGNSVAIDDIFSEHAGQVDLLITSPPYATALPYLDTDRLSLVALGLLSRRQHPERERLMIGTREVSEAMRRDWWSGYESRRADLPTRVTTLIDDIAKSFHADGVGFRRRNLPALLSKYFLNMLDAMMAARRLMRAGASGFYIVGNNSTTIDGTRVEIPTDEFLAEIGLRAGWSSVDARPMELLPSRDIFRENRGSKETILWFTA